jgi:predicted nucleotidyltransferase
VTNVRVFGSTARGTEGPESDIDLLVDVAPDVGLFGLARLEIALSELLGLPVDVVPASSLRDRIAEDVLNEAVPL